MRGGTAIRLTRDRLRGALHFGFAIPMDRGMQNYERMRFLYDMVVREAVSHSGFALEIGCFHGCSTVFLAKACQSVGIRSIDSVDLFPVDDVGCGASRDRRAVAMKSISRYHLREMVTLVRADSGDYCPERDLDVLHIDGDHSWVGVKRDIDRFVPRLSPGGLVVFDDYDWAHDDVRRAVNELMHDDPTLQLIGVCQQGDEWGSICLRRRG